MDKPHKKCTFCPGFASLHFGIIGYSTYSHNANKPTYHWRCQGCGRVESLTDTEKKKMRKAGHLH
jgi:Fe2+ or Zn2+ uptake regulation protein